MVPRPPFVGFLGELPEASGPGADRSVDLSVGECAFTLKDETEPLCEPIGIEVGIGVILWGRNEPAMVGATVAIENIFPQTTRETAGYHTVHHPIVDTTIQTSTSVLAVHGNQNCMPGPVFLRGETVTLRPADAEDLDFIQRCMNDPRVWRPALDVSPTNSTQVREFFETVISSPNGVHCLICADSDPLGIISLTESRYGPDETTRSRTVELAYWLAPEYHGQGYGSDGATQLITYAFEDKNFRRIEAAVGSFNEPSIGLLESLGFQHEGTRREAAWYRGEYHDMQLYGLLRAEWREQI